jgi:HSP20 family protein
VFRKKTVKPVVEDREENLVHTVGSESLVAQEAEGQLAIDVYQTPDEIIVESTIAGVKGDDIDVDVTSERVTIRGERRKETMTAEGDYFYQECFWGKFSRSVILPQEIDPDKAHSTIKNGVLTIHLPKLHRDRARKVKVREA